MDPDSSGQPVEVFCDVEKGVTEVKCWIDSLNLKSEILDKHTQYLYPQIGHDHLGAENVTWCQGEGCYSLNLTYDVPIQQIEALIAMSDACEQEIKFEVSVIY